MSLPFGVFFIGSSSHSRCGRFILAVTLAPLIPLLLVFFFRGFKIVQSVDGLCWPIRRAERPSVLSWIGALPILILLVLNGRLVVELSADSRRSDHSGRLWKPRALWMAWFRGVVCLDSSRIHRS